MKFFEIVFVIIGIIVMAAFAAMIVVSIGVSILTLMGGYGP